jgi:hypothetical protein
MKLLSWLSCMLCFISCDVPVPNFGSKEDRITIKEIEHSSAKIEWFTYSAAYANFPNFVTVETKDRVDTICISTNVADMLDMGGDSIKLGFYGSPKKYDEIIKIPLKAQSYTIVSDTTYIYKQKSK